MPKPAAASSEPVEPNQPRPGPPPRPSATLVLVRERQVGELEVLMLLRADRGDQNSLRWVFPGGLVDATEGAVARHFDGLDDAAASARIGIASGGLDYWSAALRETLEEAGLLLAVDGEGRAVDTVGHASLLLDWRTRARDLPRGEGGAAFAALCASQRWRLPAPQLLPIGHWVTPLGLPKRFDTLFFLAALPGDPPVLVDGVEIVDHRWARPSQLLGPGFADSVRGPTRFVIDQLARQPGVGAALDWARALGPIETIRPRLARDARGTLGPVHPSHPAYAEIGRIDPLGRGLAHSTLRAGVAVSLVDDRVIRLTANNPGMMTGPGTNTYLLHGGGDDWVLIDPGPVDAIHLQATLALLDSLSARLVAVLVTHTHLDHSPAAHALCEATGARRFGRIADRPEAQDASFVADTVLHGGERLDFGGGCIVRVIHTPGHASNHLCYLDEAQRILFSGDQVMQGSTVVINPPDGDMGLYLDSLARLADEAGQAYDTIAPGHGFLIEQPARVLRALTAHREQRAAKVRRVLAEAPSASLDELVVKVYDDVEAARHAVARRSLLAHLLLLRQQGQAHRIDGRWAAPAVR